MLPTRIEVGTAEPTGELTEHIGPLVADLFGEIKTGLIEAAARGEDLEDAAPEIWSRAWQYLARKHKRKDSLMNDPDLPHLMPGKPYDSETGEPITASRVGVSSPQWRQGPTEASKVMMTT